MAQLYYTNHLISTIFIVLLHLTIWLPQSTTLPQGAPETICDTMLPFHGGGILPSNAVPPFRIETSTATIGQGQTLRVDITGVPSGLAFGGFMIQARNNNPPYQIIGQFNPSEDGLSKLMNCENSVRNSVTHTSTVPKTEISLEWQSPVDFEGEIVFNSTVAQAYDTFWVGLPSSPVSVVKREIAPQGPTTPRPSFAPSTRTPYVPEYVPPPPAPVADDPFYAECGTSKNCFGNKDGCVDSKTCDFVAAVKVRGGIYEFELKSKAANAAYVALGLSEDNQMGDDLVIECIPQNGKVSMYSSLTSGKAAGYGVSRLGVPQNTARLVESSVVNGVIYCKVERDPVTKVGNRIFDLENNKYYLLLAAGSGLKENGVGYHNIGRLPSDKAINLADLQDLGAASTLMLRLHGSFMIAAWIGTTSLGIIFARYFKQTWVGSQMCGKDQWFAWHRICMVTTWTLTMAAFIIIFVEIDGWSGERNPHAILGTITTILCFIQPIGALFRPAPNSKNRPFFNWAHWLGGNLAHLLAIVTIFFSVKLAKAQLPEWMDWILVAYVAFHVVVHLIFSIFLCIQISGCSSDKQHTKRVNDFQMGNVGHHHGMRNNMKMERKMDAPYAGFRKGLLVVYTVVLILFVVALIVIVALAPIEDTFNKLKSKLN
ncbi:putative ferric-chelate reductase 1 homolog isoform X1 [Lucilia cuprina]|uniref:putative ferric-chelate reductase 1 homolog isoform X1 n=1 Tax=Lucilia cuprina TaxID=7375 RepID=UPI001F054AA9|nr:putative ferric-chelate reductase 1 homolog isoform X1 [Lucilia cuprina]XP_046809532.1 putative ferric-chelate reductase 1 homolog isoform X1 [Lucilia cuprina]